MRPSGLKKYECIFHLIQPPKPEQVILRQIYEICSRPVVGNRPTLDGLEAEVDKFILGIGKERFLLIHGPPGSGKSLLVNYLGSYATMKKDVEQVDLSIVSFDVKSAYAGGSLMEFQNQVDEIRHNSRKKYMIIQDDFDTSMDQSDRRLNIEVYRFLADEDISNYLIIGVTNQINAIAPTLKDRSRVVYWNGAVTAPQKADLCWMQFYPELNPKMVDLSTDDLNKLGQLAYELGLSGRDITAICSNAMISTVNQDAAAMLIKPNQGSEHKDKPPLHSHKVTYEIVERMMIGYANQPEIECCISQAP